MKLMMLDIETFGTTPRAPIFEVAALTFNPDLAAEGADANEPLICDTFHEFIDPVGCMLKGATPDPGTVEWWQGQVREGNGAAGRIVSAGRQAPHVLSELNDFFEQEQPDKLVANSPSFDGVIVEEAMRRWGIKPAWSFRDYLDQRSLIWARNLLLSPATGWASTSHDALDDCRNQARKVSEALTGIVRIGGSFD